MRILLTWTDRSGLEARRGHHVARAPGDRGPILRLLEQRESQRAYDAAWVLSTPEFARASESLASDMRAFVPDVELQVVPIDDPSDHEQLFHSMSEVVRRLPPRANVTVVLSAGTPQAQTLWVVLVKSGVLEARMLQVIPPAFVPRPHPKALREVTLDIAGFPEMRALREEVFQLRAREGARSGLIGHSTVMQTLRRHIERVATARVPTLVLGETGSGKELVARAIHYNGPRRAQPFVTENCAAIPETLLESTLFGHVKGAFTGASRGRPGLFSLAHGGTLFLDEIGEMSLGMQSKLLRVIETGEVRPVGGEHSQKVDVRVVGATQRDLEAMVKSGTFRQDLLFRLNVISVRVPPLRERREDVLPLMKHFLEKYRPGQPPALSRSAADRLEGYDWPGNVRELENEARRALVMAEDLIMPEHLSAKVQGRATLSVDPDDLNVRRRIDQLETALVTDALERTGGNQTRAAELLGLSRFGLQKMMKRLQILRPLVSSV
ncbi:MAG: sigma-54 dependent transcriptional regulator [Polyangiaceae bacterium]